MIQYNSYEPPKASVESYHTKIHAGTTNGRPYLLAQVAKDVASIRRFVPGLGGQANKVLPKTTPSPDCTHSVI